MAKAARASVFSWPPGAFVTPEQRGEKNRRDRERMREKRLDPEYRAAQKAARVYKQKTPRAQLPADVVSRLRAQDLAAQKRRLSDPATRARHNAVSLDSYRRNWSARRAAVRAARLANLDAEQAKSRARNSAYRAKDPEKARASMRKSYRKNIERLRTYYRELAARRRTAVVEWADRNAISEIYRRAAQMTRETGVEHEVDHIVPIKGRNVCGLHCEANLQILTALENRRKHNRCP